jgi:hypothetical protein
VYDEIRVVFDFAFNLRCYQQFQAEFIIAIYPGLFIR